MMLGCPVPRSHSNEAFQGLDQYLLVAADEGLAILPPLVTGVAGRLVLTSLICL